MKSPRFCGVAQLYCTCLCRVRLPIGPHLRSRNVNYNPPLRSSVPECVCFCRIPRLQNEQEKKCHLMNPPSISANEKFFLQDWRMNFSPTLSEMNRNPNISPPPYAGLRTPPSLLPETEERLEENRRNANILAICPELLHCWAPVNNNNNNNNNRRVRVLFRTSYKLLIPAWQILHREKFYRSGILLIIQCLL